jgi:uncharacterized protein (UPF0371 family)
LTSEIGFNNPKESKDSRGFDNKKYFRAQSKAILERCSKFSKLYLELGGKLLFDGHASRVLPGYDGKNKIKLLRRMRNKIEVIYCINAQELEKQNTWSDTGLTLDKLALKETHVLKRNGIKVLGIAINRFNGEKKAIKFKEEQEKHGRKVFFTKEINGYPNNLKKVFGEKGFESQEHIKTTRPIVVVTGAGAGSGKMFLCMSQVYGDDKLGINSGYAKWETFPIWNLPITHPVNIAYEAATADLGDRNMHDTLHEKSYGVKSVNYNRDIENFVLLKKIISQFVPKNNFMHKYKSPTDMGINYAKQGIINDEIVTEAARAEILRRYYFFKEKIKRGETKKETLKRMEKLLQKAGIKLEK